MDSEKKSELSEKNSKQSEQISKRRDSETKFKVIDSMDNEKIQS